MNPGPGNRTESLELPAYFGLAFGISWCCWLPAALFGDGVGVPWVQSLVYAGSAGPPLAAIALLRLNGTRAQREDFWDRVWDFRRLGRCWIAAIVLIYPVLTALAATLDWALTGHGTDWDVLAQLVSDPVSMAAHLVLALALGPIPEELGWRGYALDRLQARRPALGAALLLGIAWAAWHLPLFFVEGSYQNGLGFGTLEFWLYILTAIAASVLISCVYNSNDRSILSAILVHGVLNLTRSVVILSAMAELGRTLLLVALAIGVVVAVGAQTLAVVSRRPGSGG